MTKKEIAKNLNEELEAYYNRYMHEDGYTEIDITLGYEADDIYKDDKGYYIVVNREAVYIPTNKEELFYFIDNYEFVGDIIEYMIIRYI